MIGTILGFISNIFKPAADLIDDIHTSGEEEGAIKVKLRELTLALTKIESEVTLKVLEYEGKLLDIKAKIINTEATSDIWIVAAWRPITMLVFVSIVISYWFGYQPANMTPETISDVFDLIKIGLGGYVVGRSGEKIAKILKK